VYQVSSIAGPPTICNAETKYICFQMLRLKMIFHACKRGSRIIVLHKLLPKLVPRAA
jgi:hypothetical protein